MSYSLSLQLAADADKNAVEAAVQAKADEAVPEPQRSNAAEAIRVAADAAYILKAKIARSGDSVIVNISGHANEGCNPTPGWSDCAVTVSLSQVPPKG